MQLDSYLAAVAEQLRAVAALGDDRTREVATTLAAAMTPAVRLALLGAVSAVADELTDALLDSPGSPAVSVRLDGDDVAVDVQHPAAADDSGPADDGETTARISLRLSETLKAEIDAAADRDGVSVNTWLARAAASALRSQAGGPFGPGGPLGAGMPPFGRGARRGPGNRSGSGGGTSRITGWVTG